MEVDDAIAQRVLEIYTLVYREMSSALVGDGSRVEGDLVVDWGSRSLKEDA